MRRARLRQARYAMGTLVEIIACSPDDGEALLAAVSAAFAEFERLDALLSRFDEASELSRLNRAAARAEVIASPELFGLLRAAVEYAAASGGVFDVTVAPLVQLWSRCAEAQRLPAAEEVNAAKGLVGREQMVLDASRRGVRFTCEGVAVDFGGLAKGYAVDRAVEMLRAGGASGALVNAGTSSIAGFGAEGPDGWLIGVRHPLSEDHLIGTLSLRDAALSSSGSYERPLTIGPRSYSHIMDPRRGAPAEGALGATVMTDSAMRGEVMSKMLLLLGCADAFARFDELGWEAEGLLLTEADGGRVGVWRSDGLTGFQPLI